MEKENRSLWEVFQEIPDGRGRQGRIHRLADLLAMIFVAVMAGETTLRGIVQWLTERETEWMKCKRLELWRMPSYSTYYWALRKLEMDAFSEKVLGWLGEEDKGDGRCSMDGKSLRGSKRAGKQALKVVELLAQKVREVRGISWAKEGKGEQQAALEVLMNFVLEGKVITADAGLLNRPVVKQIVEQGGGYLGVIKKNQEHLHADLETLFESEKVLEREPDDIQTGKAHGRLETRRLWAIRLEEDWQKYFSTEEDWPAAQWAGVIERERTILSSGKSSSERQYWIAGAAFPLNWEPAQWQQAIREHWQIENGLFHVRDVTFNEDRQTARHIAPPLSLFRDLVISLIRRAGFPFIPDGRRYAQAHYHQLFPWRLFPSSSFVNS